MKAAAPNPRKNQPLGAQLPPGVVIAPLHALWCKAPARRGASASAIFDAS
jgi:hypothetical protein